MHTIETVIISNLHYEDENRISLNLHFFSY